MSTGMSLRWFLMMSFLPLWMLPPGLLLMIFGLFGVGVQRMGLFRAYSQAGGPTEAGSAAFLGRGLLRIRKREEELLAAGDLVGYIGPVWVMKWMCIVLSTLLTLLLLLQFSFVGVLSLLRMYSKVFGVRVYSV